MKIPLAIAGATALVAGGVQISGVLKPGAVYAKPYDVAYAELAATPIPPMVADMIPGSTPRVIRNAGSIVWQFGDTADRGATFTAYLSKEDAGHTRVSVIVEVAKSDDKIAGPYLNSAFILNIGKQAMAEQVAAELEDRAFDKVKYGTRLAAYMTSHPQDLTAYGETIRNTMNDVATQVNGYPTKAGNAHQPLSDTLAGFGQASAQMDAKTIRDAQNWSSSSDSAPPSDPPVDSAQVRYDSTHPATDLSAYR